MKIGLENLLAVPLEKTLYAIPPSDIGKQMAINSYANSLHNIRDYIFSGTTQCTRSSGPG